MDFYEAWNYAEEEQARAQNGSEVKGKGKGGYKGKGGKGKGGKARKGKGTSSTPTERVGDWSCASCGFQNFSWRWQCWSCREPNRSAFEPMNYEGNRPMFFPARNPPPFNPEQGAQHAGAQRYPGSQFPGIAGQIRNLPDQGTAGPQTAVPTQRNNQARGWENREPNGPKDYHKKEIAKYQRALEAVTEVYGEDSDQVKDMATKLEKAKEDAKQAANILTPAVKRRQIEGALGRCEAALLKVHQEYELLEGDIKGWQARVVEANERRAALHKKGTEMEEEKARLEQEMADCAMHLAGRQALLPIRIDEIRQLPLEAQLQAKAMLDGVSALIQAHQQGPAQKATVSAAGAAALMMTQPNFDHRDQVNQSELKPGDMITLSDGTGMIIGGMLPGEREDVELSEVYPEVEEEVSDEEDDPIEDSSEEERQARSFQRVGKSGKPVRTKREKGPKAAPAKVRQEALKGEPKHGPRVVPPPKRTEVATNQQQPLGEEEAGNAKAATEETGQGHSDPGTKEGAEKNEERPGVPPPSLG